MHIFLSFFGLVFWVDFVWCGFGYRAMLSMESMDGVTSLRITVNGRHESI